MKRAIVWFRNDLRLHDNEAISDALLAADEVLYIYVFDTRLTQGRTKFGFRKLGAHRATFIIDAIIDLRKKLRAKGADLIVRSGIPEEIVSNLAREAKASWVHCNRERTDEEVKVQDAMESLLWTIGVELRYNRGKMLYHTADLPFPITQSPDVFTAFRKEVEKIVPVRKPVPTAENFKKDTLDLEPGVIPTLNDLNIDHQPESIYPGGETAALQRLDYYIKETGLVSQYKETRNGLLGKDYSSKFSAYLSKGCLSPKLVFWQLKEYEEANGENESTYSLFFELLWRDFFRLIGKKYGNAIFQKSGIVDRSKGHGSEEISRFNIWKEGRTGFPIVDACMRELNATGFMSNRGRQISASFLINEMKMNWIIGAEYFESKLIDYDPCSNYCNWAYIAGVGTDPRGGRHFNIKYQSQKHDPHGEFIKHWIPILKDIPADKLHDMQDYKNTSDESGPIIIGKDYPAACVQI